MFRCFLFLISILVCANITLATGIPRPIGGENRIKIINYTPNTVFKFTGHYEYQSIIEFGMDEEVDTISMGTPTPWQIVPAGNRIFLKPVEDNATTNMTVITNKRMYFFEMHAEEALSVNDDSLNFVVKFVYPDQFSGMNYASSSSGKSKVGGATSVGTPGFNGPDLSKPEDYNFKYTISGTGVNIEPQMVFDDGEFTYFKFKDVNATLPAIYYVGPDGKEALVNFRVAKGFIWVERVADRFTLRQGSSTICVFNETGTFKKRPRKLQLF